MSSPLNVLIAGGGVAGLEALLALNRLAADRVRVTLLTPEREFVYRPMSVATPFARGRATRHELGKIAAALDAELVEGELAEVDVPGRVALTADGSRVAFDALLVAIGAASEPALSRVPTWTPELDQEVFGGLLRDLQEGYSRRVAFIVPPGATWPLPAYELALMTAWDARDMGRDDIAVTVYTPEPSPLAMFGAAAGEALAGDLAEVGVDVQTGVRVREDEAVPKRLVADPGGRPLDVERVIALTRAAARSIAGVPVDERGFIRVDAHGRVEGADGVWAAGDAIAFPIKQGGLAAQQADAAAESIAAHAGAAVEPQPFRPVLRGVLLTGRGRQWIRRDLDEDEGSAERHALWWPPTKVAGRYLAPYLLSLEEDQGAERPAGQLVELDASRDVPAVTEAMDAARRQAGER